MEGKGIYWVSNFGRIKSLLSGDLKNIQMGKYPGFAVYCEGVRKNCHTHRAVWEAFNGPIPKGMVINHLDGNKYNPALSNLECVTPSQNLKHAYDNKLRGHDRGSAWHRSKLTEDKVEEIIKLRKSGMSLDKIGKKFGVNVITVGDIFRGKSWKHVTGIA